MWIRTFQERILSWYRKNARKDLPWRKTRNPYAIWISEIMLQQTQVKKVIPYYERFLKRFPTVSHLAKAPLTRVLESWAGLGYYSRAKNLHAAARKIVRLHGGQIPSQPEELLGLPGVGRYTAGAIASIAFDLPAPILDGNVTRVLCRAFGIRGDVQSPATQKKLWRQSEELLPRKSPGTFNQALMELGALVCTPSRPACPICPLKADCFAYAHRLQETLPRPKIATIRKKITYLCGILERDGKILMARRPLAGLLPGLWEFPGGEYADGKLKERALARFFRERLGIGVRPKALPISIRQILSHRTITIRPFRCSRNGGILRPGWYTEVRWVAKKELERVPMTAGMLKLASELWGRTEKGHSRNRRVSLFSTSPLGPDS